MQLKSTADYMTLRKMLLNSMNFYFHWCLCYVTPFHKGTLHLMRLCSHVGKAVNKVKVKSENGHRSCAV